MPRFFFDYRENGELARDLDGIDLPDLDAAHREAIRAAVDVWTDALRERRYPGANSFEIRDTNGRVLATVPLRRAFFGGGSRDSKVIPTGQPGVAPRGP